jgi:hydroxyacylglutathione hydrolase
MIKIYTVVITPFAQNCRILHDTESDEVITVDPGGDVSRIVSVLRQKNLLSSKHNFSKILLTHAHVDHGGGVEEYMDFLRSEFSAEPELLFHRDNDLYRDTLTIIAARYGLPETEYRNVPPASAYVEDDELISFGSFSLQALYTPGHAPGHLAFYISHASVAQEIIDANYGVTSGESLYEGPVLIAGDTLFRGSIGRTDLPGGNHQQLLNSIADKLMVLPDETLVMSGHGPDTTIGDERNGNPFL